MGLGAEPQRTTRTTEVVEPSRELVLPLPPVTKRPYPPIIKFCKDEVVEVDTRLVIGSERKLDGALLESEDSNKLNTSFIERLSLTTRRARRT